MPYSPVWMSKYLTAGSRVLKDLAVRLEAAAAALRGMRAPGVCPGPDGDTDNGFPLRTTDDPQVAERLGCEPPAADD
jgi:hypothetical protein